MTENNNDNETAMEEKTRIISVRNEQGIKVKRFCGSCSHKMIDGNGQRICLLTQQKVKQSGRCRKWEMNENFRTLNIKD